MPAIEETIAAGINVNVTLLFSVESYAAIAEAYIRGMERRHEAGESLDIHSVASFFVSRVDTEVDKRLAELGQRGPARHRRGRQRARRLHALQGALPRRALRRAARGGRAGPAPAVGVDRREGPALPRDQVRRRRSSRPDTVNTMPMPTLLACAEELEVTGATADQDPSRGPEAARRRRHRHGRRDEEAARARASTKFVEPFDNLIGGIELTREGDRHRPARRRSSRRSPTTSSRRSSSACRRPQSEDVAQARLGAGRVALGRAGRGRDRQPARLADDQRQDARARGRPARVRRAGEGRRPRARRAARHGRLEPRARGDPALVRRRAGRDAPARARLDRPRRGARHRARGRPRQDALHRLVEVGRHDRDAVAHALLLRAHGRRRRRSFCAVTDPGSPLVELGARARLPARVRERPGHRRPLLGALVLRPRAGRAAPA